MLGSETDERLIVEEAILKKNYWNICSNYVIFFLPWEVDMISITEIDESEPIKKTQKYFICFSKRDYGFLYHTFFDWY